MLNKKSNLVERRLYEYVLHAVCSPLRVTDTDVPSERLAAHVAKLFNIDPDEHDDIYVQAITKQACPVILSVDVKKARDLLGEDQNGLSDPYCKVAVIYNPKESNGTGIIQTPPDTPTSIRRTASLFSCASSSTGKSKSKHSSSNGGQKRVSRQLSVDRLHRLLSDKTKTLNPISYRTEIRPKTINPEWNEHFEFEIEHVNQQHLQVTVLDSDRGQELGVKTVVQEKRGLTKKMQGIRRFFATGEIDDDFLGQITFDIKSLAIYNGAEKWFPLCSLNQNRSSSTKARGDILLGFKVQFKLLEQITGLTKLCSSQTPNDIKVIFWGAGIAFHFRHTLPLPRLFSPLSFVRRIKSKIYFGFLFEKDDKKSREHRRIVNDSALEFRRRHSSLDSNKTASTSIILRPSIFRSNFRPAAMRVRDYSRTNIFEDDLQTQINRNDSCLTPATDSDPPLLIEEYHQLFRIVMLHQLEDSRESEKDESNRVFINWDGSLNRLSVNVLTQFRVLYNIPILSESFIQLLVIMELRCSEDYAKFISQGIIDGYLKPFMAHVRQRTDTNDLDFTDYEKTVFKDILYLFIDHYKRLVPLDAPWFLPSNENLPNIQSIIETICTLLQLKICTNEILLKHHLEETIRVRLQTDINDSFTVNSFVFDESDGLQINQMKDLVKFAFKIKQSMDIIPDYQKLFSIFNVDYIKICFFETNSAADQLSDAVICLLTHVAQYFQTYSKPMFKATSSIYDPNLIQSSSELLHLYLYIQRIVARIRDNLDGRDWITNAYKLKLIHYEKWFSPIMKYLIEGFVAQIRQTMERAIENDNEIPRDDDVVLHSQYADAATRLCIQICEEWEAIEFPEIDVRYTALVKLTNTICEQCQHYARRTNKKLTENRYFTDLDRTRSFNVSRKLCMLVNDIEYVKRHVLSSLPNLLHFSDVIDKMIQKYETDNFKQLQTTLERLIATAEQEMTDVIKLILDHVAEFIRLSLKSKIKSYYIDEKRGRQNCMSDVNRYINEEVLVNLYKGLDPVQYSRIACAIRVKVIQCLGELLPLSEPSDFYERVLVSFNQLVRELDVACTDEMNKPSPRCDEIDVFKHRLEICALTTEQLQLQYFREVLQMHSLYDSGTTYGEIVLRAAHDNINGLITITVLIISCRNLPKMDLVGSSDPYVILELLPSSIYHRQVKEYRTTTLKRNLEPEYNESFQWHRLPTNVLYERGAVLRLSVWDKDMFRDDFIGECFIPLTNIPSMKDLASIRDVPVITMHLTVPKKNNQPNEFELIKTRVTFDDQAATFIKQRQLALQSSTTSDGISLMSDDRNSTGSFGSIALRSLLHMLPFNIGFGFDTNVNKQSDLTANNNESI